MTKLILTTADELSELVRLAVRQEIGEQPSLSNTDRKYLSIEDAALYLGIPKATLYQFTSQRIVPFIKSGRRLMFSKNDLELWLASRRKATRQEIEKEVYTKKTTKK